MYKIYDLNDFQLLQNDNVHMTFVRSKCCWCSYHRFNFERNHLERKNHMNHFFEIEHKNTLESLQSEFVEKYMNHIHLYLFLRYIYQIAHPSAQPGLTTHQP